MSKKIILLLCLFPIFLFSCQEEGPDVPGEVEFYLLDFYECYFESAGIDTATMVLDENPFLNYAALKSYNSRDYFFKVSDDAKDKIEGMEHSVAGVAFAVLANKEVIYTGYFLPSYSSISLQWIVIDPVSWHLKNQMFVKLGYPGQIDGLEIPDLRNDERILQIFRRDRKLVE